MIANWPELNVHFKYLFWFHNIFLLLCALSLGKIQRFLQEKKITKEKTRRKNLPKVKINFESQCGWPQGVSKKLEYIYMPEKLELF